MTVTEMFVSGVGIVGAVVLLAGDDLSGFGREILFYSGVEIPVIT